MKNIMRKTGILSLILLLVVGLTACGGPKETPSQVVALYMNAIIDGDYEALNAYTGLDEDASTFTDAFEEGFVGGFGSTVTQEDLTAMSNAMFNALNIVSFDVLNETIDGDIATVELEIYGIDFNKLMADLMAELMSLAMSGEVAQDQLEAKTIQLMIKHLDAAVPVTTPSKPTITLIKEQGKWILDEAQMNTLIVDGIMDMSNIDI